MDWDKHIADFDFLPWLCVGEGSIGREERRMMEKSVNESIIAEIDRIVAEEYFPTDLVFFAYWAWWEALGKPNDYLGYKMLVLCPQDNKYHTPQEIKKKGWDRSEDERE